MWCILVQNGAVYIAIVWCMYTVTEQCGVYCNSVVYTVTVQSGVDCLSVVYTFVVRQRGIYLWKSLKCDITALQNYIYKKIQ